MVYHFLIQGRLPGTNEIISQATTNKFGYGKFKKKNTDHCAEWALVGRIPKFDTPIDISIDWIEPNKRRDLDNIAGGIKFILDGLVKIGCIKNDTQEWVKSIKHSFSSTDPKNPRIIVYLSC